MRPLSSHQVRRRLRGVPSIAWILLALLAVFSVIAPHFATSGNVVNIIRQGAVLMIVAIGMTIAIANAGIDLSVGSLIGLSGVLIATALRGGLDWPLAVMVGILACSLAGLISGLVIAKGRIFPFVVTFGMLFIARSVALGLSMSGSVHIDNPAFSLINEGYFLDLPLPFWITSAIFLVVLFLVKRTVFGRYAFTIGSDVTNAGWMGIKTDLYRVLVYILSGTLAGIAGTVLASRVNTGNANIGQGTEFMAIAAVVIGGTSFDGGRGSLVGTILGALLITCLQNGLTLMGFSSEANSAIVGVSLMVGVIIAQAVYRRGTRGSH